MNQEELAIEARKMNRWEKHRFMLLVGLTIVISLFLVMISMGLYNSSGAAQLDLSRPGYKSVREQVTKTETFRGFPSSGSIDQSTLDEFKNLYKKQASKATAIDSFGGDVMSDEALSLSPPTDE